MYIVFNCQTRSRSCLYLLQHCFVFSVR